MLHHDSDTSIMVLIEVDGEREVYMSQTPDVGPFDVKVSKI